MTLSSRARAHACGAHLSYPRGMVALDPASVLLDGLPLDAISTHGARTRGGLRVGVQGSVLPGRGC